jgi:two-component system KDP operon response regulator KdpE
VPRVLIVNDDKTQLRLMQGGLARENMEVDFARDARETFEAIYRQIPNLIILDLGLSDVDGLEILRSIRVEPRYDPVVIIFSADHDSESKIKALDLGAVKYLEKPLHIKEISAHIRAILRFKLKQNQTFEEYKRLSELSLIDPLTGAYNRRALDTFL